MPKRHMDSAPGFSLVEVMIAILLLGIGMVAIAAMQTQNVNSADHARRAIVDTLSVGNQLEHILAMPYNDALLIDTDGEYLLDQPDHGPYPIADTRSTIEWEVNDDAPSVNSKRVTVTVNRQGKGGIQHQVRYDYIKVRGYTP